MKSFVLLLFIFFTFYSAEGLKAAESISSDIDKYIKEKEEKLGMPIPHVSHDTKDGVLDICGSLYEMYGQLSHSGAMELQQEEYFNKGLKGRVIRITSRLKDMSKSGDTYKLWLDQPRCVGIFAYIRNPPANVVSIMLSLNKGDTVTVEGEISSYSTAFGASFSVVKAKILY